MRSGPAIGLVMAMCLTGCAGIRAVFHPPQPVCDAGPVQQYLGRAAGQGLARQMLRRAHARQFRYLRPDMITTREFRADRLDAMLDAQDRITRLTCG